MCSPPPLDLTASTRLGLLLSDRSGKLHTQVLARCRLTVTAVFCGKFLELCFWAFDINSEGDLDQPHVSTSLFGLLPLLAGHQKSPKIACLPAVL